MSLKNKNIRVFLDHAAAREDINFFSSPKWLLKSQYGNADDDACNLPSYYCSIKQASHTVRHCTLSSMRAPWLYVVQEGTFKMYSFVDVFEPLPKARY